MSAEDCVVAALGPHDSVLSPVLFVQPRRDHPVHHGMPDFGSKALQARVIDLIGEPDGNVYLVRFVGQVALDLVHDVLALLRVQLSPLGDEHFIERRVVDMAAIVGLAGIEEAVQKIIPL